MAFLTVDDLLLFAPSLNEDQAEQMIADAEAMAVLAAPCLDVDDSGVTLTDNQENAVKAVLRAAILRWHEAGTGALQSQQVGPFGQTFDTRQQRRGMFWPSEIEQLQSICGSDDKKAFTVDTMPATIVVHAEICALVFGAEYCSCGAWLTLGLPLYESPA